MTNETEKERRREDFDPLSKATSIAKAFDPNSFPYKKVREEHQPIIEDQKKIFTLADFIPFGNIKEQDQTSLTTSLYDAIPRFWLSKKIPRKHGKYLDALARPFRFNKETYHAHISPAEHNGKFHYPGKIEELVEVVLVQLSMERGAPMIDQTYGVPNFSIYEIRERLKQLGHKLTFLQIKKALYVLSGTTLTITTPDGMCVLRDTMVAGLGLRTFDDWKEQGRKSYCCVRFNPLLTKALQSCTWRLYNIESVMLCDNNLARWMLRKMFREWSGIGSNSEYTWKLKDIIRDSGSQISDAREAKRRISDALDCLSINPHKEANKTEIPNKPLLSWRDTYKVGGMRGTKKEDVGFHLKPTLSFIAQMKRLNQLRRDALDEIGQVNKIAEKNHVKKLPFG